MLPTVPAPIASVPPGLLPDRPATAPSASAIAAAVRAATSTPNGGPARASGSAGGEGAGAPGAGAGAVEVTAADGFAAVLAQLQRAPSVDPRTLPTVSLDQMVRAVAGASLTPAAPLGDPTLSPLGPAGPEAVAGSAAPAAVPGAAVPGAAGPGAAGPGAAGGAAGGSSGRGAEVLTAGERYLGVPYRWGGTSARTGFDCSGFVQQVFGDLGVRLPRVSVDQAKQGTAVANLDAARPGDLVFWRATNGRPNHIGIYAGQGRMLVAPRTGDVVRYQEISRTPDAIRRVV